MLLTTANGPCALVVLAQLYKQINTFEQAMPSVLIL